MFILLFFFNDTATTEIYTLSLHDALPICRGRGRGARRRRPLEEERVQGRTDGILHGRRGGRDRSEEHTNSSHSQISYAVFCLKKKNKKGNRLRLTSSSSHTLRSI